MDILNKITLCEFQYADPHSWDLAFTAIENIIEENEVYTWHGPRVDTYFYKHHRLYEYSDYDTEDEYGYITTTTSCNDITETETGKKAIAFLDANIQEIRKAIIRRNESCLCSYIHHSPISEIKFLDHDTALYREGKAVYYKPRGYDKRRETINKEIEIKKDNVINAIINRPELTIDEIIGYVKLHIRLEYDIPEYVEWPKRKSIRKWLNLT